MTLDWLYIARDGALLALGACGLIALIVLRAPRLLLRHFPEGARAALAPKTAAERGRSLVTGLLLIGWILGVVAVSTALADARLAPGFAPRFAHAWLVGMAFDLADWLILDELWLGRFPPRGLMAAAGGPVPFDRRKHFADFLKGAVGFAVIAAGVAGVLVLV